MPEQTLPTPDLCGRIATIGATEMACENHAGHAEPCWYNVPSSRPISPPSPAETPIRECCERLTRLVFALATWNDHNFTTDDHARWRRAAEKEALRAVELLNAAPAPTESQTATPEPREAIVRGLQGILAATDLPVVNPRRSLDKIREIAAYLLADIIIADANASTAAQLAPRAAQPATTELTDDSLRAGGIACAGERDAARKDGRLEDARAWERHAHALHAAVRTASPSRETPELNGDWCVKAFHRVNPGAAHTPYRSVPSLYLLDFARAVLAEFSDLKETPPHV